MPTPRPKSYSAADATPNAESQQDPRSSRRVLTPASEAEPAPADLQLPDRDGEVAPAPCSLLHWT